MLKHYLVRVNYKTCITLNVLAENSKMAIDVAEEQIDEMDDEEYKNLLKDNLQYDKAVAETAFMDCTNGHNETLVNKINIAFSTEPWDKLGFIMKALYHRDLDECVSKGVLTGNEELWANDFDWDAHSYNYLMHVADDQDLETILAFLRT